MPKMYQTEQIRNIALLGHSGSGKTSLVEAMLFNAGGTNRLGKVEEGNTVSDYDDEEIRRVMSINAAIIPIEWESHKINVLDTPGTLDFVGEVIGALSVAEVAALVLDGSAGVEVGALLAWKNAVNINVPRAVFINKMERENASYQRVLAELRERFDDATFVPMQLPIRNGETFEGVVDLLTLKAHRGTEGSAGAPPDDMSDEIETFRLEMLEAAAEADEELMMKYFDDEELTNEEIAFGLETGIKSGQLVPVFCGSATLNVAVRAFMKNIITSFPAPNRPTPVTKGDSEDVAELPLDPSGPIVMKIFKTVDDQYGSVSYFKVVSGTASSDIRLTNVNADEEERLGQLFSPRGKEHLSIDGGKVACGDIGAVVKLSHTKTGDTLCEKGVNYKVVPAKYPNPLYAVAISPKTQADSGKMGPTLQRLTAADPTLRTRADRNTRQTILEGMGDAHISVTVHRMAERYGLNVDVAIPKVPYLETITRTDSARYRHKKQTGGAGQFAEVELRLEPQERNTGFEMAWEVFGGAISSSYSPSIEKGIKQVLSQGVVAGYPVVDVKAAVVDGKEHPVDSKDIAFQIAGREVFREAFKKANPVLLEPIMEVSITIPENYTGDVMSDLTTKRGHVQGMQQDKGETVITALVPLAEIQRYATELRSITQGRGIYEQRLISYEVVPKHLIDVIIEQSHKEQEEQ
jgi:elongation factor G